MENSKRGKVCLVLLALVFAVFFVSCENPVAPASIEGTWKLVVTLGQDVSASNYTFTFANGSFTTSAQESGTYTSTTVTFSGTQYTYSISGNTMNWSLPIFGSVFTFSKQ